MVSGLLLKKLILFDLDLDQFTTLSQCLIFTLFYYSKMSPYLKMYLWKEVSKESIIKHVYNENHEPKAFVFFKY